MPGGILDARGRSDGGAGEQQRSRARPAVAGCLRCMLRAAALPVSGSLRPASRARNLGPIPLCSSLLGLCQPPCGFPDRPADPAAGHRLPPPDAPRPAGRHAPAGLLRPCVLPGTAQLQLRVVATTCDASGSWVTVLGSSCPADSRAAAEQRADLSATTRRGSCPWHTKPALGWEARSGYSVKSRLARSARLQALSVASRHLRCGDPRPAGRDSAFTGTTDAEPQPRRWSREHPEPQVSEEQRRPTDQLLSPPTPHAYRHGRSPAPCLALAASLTGRTALLPVPRWTSKQPRVTWCSTPCCFGEPGPGVAVWLASYPWAPPGCGPDPGGGRGGQRLSTANGTAGCPVRGPMTCRAGPGRSHMGLPGVVWLAQSGKSGLSFVGDRGELCR